MRRHLGSFSPGPTSRRWVVGKRIASGAVLALLFLVSPAKAEEASKVLTPEQETYLREHVWATLGTGRKDGSPQLSMIAYEYDGTDIAISIKSYTAKWKNILRQPKVAMLVHDGRKQLIIYGTAKAVDEDPERRELIKRVMARHRGGHIDLDDETISKMLDERQRTALRIVPEKAFMND